MKKPSEPTVTQLIADFEGTINRTIIAERKYKRYTLLKNVAIGAAAWGLIYIFWVGLVTVTR